MKPERQVADLGSNHRSPAMGSTLLFPFKLEEVRRPGIQPQLSLQLQVPGLGLAWPPWLRSPQPTMSLSAGDAAAQLVGLSAPQPPEADPSGNSHPQTWPRPSCLHPGSPPLSTLAGQRLPWGHFFSVSYHWSQEKQNPLTGSHLENPQRPRLAAGLGPVLSLGGLPSALPRTGRGARGQAACACSEGI